MLITLVIILLLIWAAVVGSIYSNFLVFYSNFNESENYHRAYYNSISALERAELVIKQRAPWFVWSWWRIIGSIGWTWSTNNWWSDGTISDFSYLSQSENIANTSTIFRSIDSKTTRVPKEWNWDIEISLSTGDSLDYNMIDYDDTQIFSLYYDKSEGNPYSWNKCPSSWCIQSNITALTWVIRLPWFLYLSGSSNSGFGLLNDKVAMMNNWPKDDAIINWEIRWNYDGSPFTVYATQSAYSWKTYPNLDSVIRESDISPALELDLWQDLSPFKDKKWIDRGGDANLTVISKKESDMKKNVNKLIDLLGSSLDNKDIKEKEFRLSLLNLLETTKDMVYPFLEYYIDFWTWISDKYFNINAEWNYGDYKINRIIRKPTNKESVLWSFTTIF